MRGILQFSLNERLKNEEKLRKILDFWSTIQMRVKSSLYHNVCTVVCILVRMTSFPRFWRNHPYCRNRWYLIWKPSWFSLGKKQKQNLFFLNENYISFHMRYHFLLYWWFFQNLEKGFIQTNMHTIVQQKKALRR